MILTDDEVGMAHLIAWNRDPLLFTLHLAQHFHLMLPMGFDEVRLCPGQSLAALDRKKLAKDLEVDVFNLKMDDDLSCGNLVWERLQKLEFRHEVSGAWYRFAAIYESSESDFSLGALGASLIFGAENIGKTLELGVEDIVESWSCEADNVTRPSVLLFPNIWTGIESGMPSVEIKNFLEKCGMECADFSKLTWRQMEELVAELLKLQGMEVTITPASNDGGRDIIARGELIPGEPTILAVEVKQKPVVGIHDVRAALYANRHMPALLIATSGRFSAGVIKESKVSDNCYRLFLKDGIGLQQWISACWERNSR